MAQPCNFDLIQNYQHMYKSGYLADVEIVCNDVSFLAHKFILVTHSSYFKEELIGDYEEFKTGVINIEEHEPHVVKAILQYLYTSFYTLDRNSEEHHSVTHANIYAAGEDLGIEGVKKLAIDQFDACMEQSPKSSFVAARTIFTTTPSFDKELRTVFINKASEHFSLVVGDTPEFQQNRDVIKDIPELAYELVLARARTNVPGNVLWKASGVFECSNCPQTGYVSKILYGGILRCPECFGILQSPTHCLQT